MALWALGAVFAVANGMNDGSTLLATGLKIPRLRVAPSAAILLAGLMVVPLIFGTQVATTLVNRMVAFDGAAGRRALIVALSAAVLVVATLSRRGMPTSLTLALIGGIAGAGLGTGLAVDWTTVLFVLGLGIAAPAAGMAGAFVLSRIPLRAVPNGHAGAAIGRLHVLAFSLQCFAYGANDGQKMLAVFAVATGATVRTTVEAEPGHLAIIGIFFAMGMLLGMRNVSRTISSGVLAVRPWDAVAAELSSGTAVLASAALGAPVSMTQSIAGGLVGSGVRYSMRRVRWAAVVRLAGAWMLTLPTAALAAALGGWAMHAAFGGQS